MGAVVQLAEWRRGEGPDASLARLERAVAQLDAALEDKARSEAPAWLVTEVFAIQGCISMELADEATERTERVLKRWHRYEGRRKRG